MAVVGPSPVRTRILEAAAVLFADHGYGTTTIREVATAVGVQPAALYRYFVSKEAILTGIGECGYRRTLSAARRALLDVASDQASEQLTALVGVCVGDWSLSTQLNVELDRLPRELARPAVALRAELWGLVFAVIERGAQRGEFRSDVDPYVLMTAVRSVCSLPFHSAGVPLAPDALAGCLSLVDRALSVPVPSLVVAP